MLDLLGKPIADSSTRQVLKAQGIKLPTRFDEPVTLLADQGIRFDISGGVLRKITFINDSVRFKGQLYKKYRGALPIGLTFADSVGLEENALFSQQVATYYLSPDHANAELALRAGELPLRLQVTYLPVQDYQYLKVRQDKSGGIHRTLTYAFIRADEDANRRLRGEYVGIPLNCGNLPSGEGLRVGNYNQAVDSVFYIDLGLGYAGKANTGNFDTQLKNGFTFLLGVYFPVSSRLSPPLLHHIQLDFNFFNYSKLDFIRDKNDNPPSMTLSSLGYGLSYYRPSQKTKTIRPIIDLLAGVNLAYTSGQAIYAIDESLSASSFNVFGQVGAGLVYRVNKSLGVKLGYQYRVNNFVRNLALVKDANGDDALSKQGGVVGLHMFNASILVTPNL